VVTLVVGIIAVRVWCEILIVFFRINETLTDIREGLAGPRPPEPPTVVPPPAPVAPLPAEPSSPPSAEPPPSEPSAL